MMCQEYWLQLFPWLGYGFWHNSVCMYLSAILLFLVGWIFIVIFRRVILRKVRALAEKTETIWDDFLIELLEKKFSPFLLIINFYLCLRYLNLSASFLKIINIIWSIFIAYFVVTAINGFLKFFVQDYLSKQGINSQAARTSYSKALLPALQVVIWILGVIFLLDNLGFNIATVVTGLGIGGVAVALAAQTLLKDFFSYFSIIFDRPFEIGDFIIVSPEFMGTVEYIGIKTTRIRSLAGEQIIFANSDLTDSRVKNYKRMAERRVVFTFSIPYESTLDQLQKIPQLVREIIQSIPNTRFDRSHFSQYGQIGFNFETVYFVLNSEYNSYMDIQQQINLEIKKQLNQMDVDFAYPVQRVLLEK